MPRSFSMTWDPAFGPNFSRSTWTNITPPVAGEGVAPVDAMVPPASYGCTWVAGNPQRPNEIWCCVDQLGLWKSTNYGVPGSWTGGQISPPNGGNTTTYFDAPFQIQWDPNNPLHGYCTQGVRGNTMGFWRTFDGGLTWEKPAGFISATAALGTSDVTRFSTAPGDFNHIILSSHSAWTGYTNAGVLESTDGGDTWTTTPPGATTWPSGTQPPHFLYDPATSQGDLNTRLVGTNGNGMWRTTNAGVLWTQVSTADSVHGGQSILYLPDGRLIIGAIDRPLISSDNGSTFTPLNNLPSGYYFGVWDGGDGYIYTGRTFRNNGYQDPMYRSPIGDAINWDSSFDTFQSGDGPEHMTRVGENIYMPCWTNGIFVKRVG